MQSGITIALDQDGSARVLSVAAGSPVAAANAVEAGDIVTQVNGEHTRHSVSSRDDFEQDFTFFLW